MIRLLSAGRAALALLSVWLALRTAIRLLDIGGEQPVPLLGTYACMIFLLFVIDLKPADRKLSLWLAPLPFAGAFLLGSYLSEYFWLSNLILLLFFFCAYSFRRYGSRAGELALIGTMGYHLGFLLRLPQSFHFFFLVLTAVSVLVVYLWEFVIIPYDPIRSLHRSVTAFYHNTARTVLSARQGLETPHESSKFLKRLQRQFQRAHQNRRVIEGLFAATVSPSMWSQARINRLQEELYATERGLERLIEAAAQIFEVLNELPKDVLHILNEGLIALEDQLWEMASKEDQPRLKQAGEQLQLKVKSSLEGKPPGEWVLPVLRIGLAVRELADSVAAIQAIKVDWKEHTVEGTTKKPPTPYPARRLDLLGKKSGVALHPTSILGLQAVLAVGLSMFAAYLLNFDKPNLVYWTAFVVIAGSTGESLRRISLRVVGVIAGTMVGVALAVILPGNVSMIAVLVTFCLFMTVYMIPASYAWMVFWLNIAILLIVTTLGGPALHLLYLRPISTLLGAAIAALVVVFVLPIHVQNRFSASLAEFLQAIDHYLEVYITSLTGPASPADLKAEEVKIDLSYKKLEHNLPNVIYEYNPLSRAQNRFAAQGTYLAALKGYVTRLEDEVGGESGVLVNDKYAYLLQGIQSEIHGNINNLINSLSQGQGDQVLSQSILADQINSDMVLKELLNAEIGSVEQVRNRAIFELRRIQETVMQIASGLGATVAV